MNQNVSSNTLLNLYSQYSEEPTQQKALLCAKAAIDKKAENLRILEIKKISSVADMFIICSAYSDRQVEAIANSIRLEMKKAELKPISVEGLSELRWVLIDYGDVVVHILIDAIREYYNLEELWSEAISIPVPSEFYGDSATRLN